MKVKAVIAVSLILIALSCIYLPYERRFARLKLQGRKISIDIPTVETSGYKFLWEISREDRILYRRLVIQIIVIAVVGAAISAIIWGKPLATGRNAPPPDNQSGD